MIIKEFNITQSDIDIVMASEERITARHNVVMQAARRCEVPFEYACALSFQFNINPIPMLYGSYKPDTYLACMLDNRGGDAFELLPTRVTLVATHSYVAKDDSVSFRGYRINKGDVVGYGGVALSDKMAHNGFEEFDKVACLECGHEFVFGHAELHRKQNCTGELRLINRSRCYQYVDFLKSLR